MDVQVTLTNTLLTVHKSGNDKCFPTMYVKHVKHLTARYWDQWVGKTKWDGPFQSDWSNQEKWSNSKGLPAFSRLFQLNQAYPFSFRPKYPEVLVELIARRGFNRFRTESNQTITPFVDSSLPSLWISSAAKWALIGSQMFLFHCQQSEKTTIMSCCDNRILLMDIWLLPALT